MLCDHVYFNKCVPPLGQTASMMKVKVLLVMTVEDLRLKAKITAKIKSYGGVKAKNRYLRQRAWHDQWPIFASPQNQI